MKHKNLAIIAILLVFCATLLGVFFGGGGTADAAVTTGTSLFTSSVGSTTVTSTPQAQGDFDYLQDLCGGERSALQAQP